MVTILLFSVENIENLTHGAFSELLIKHEIRGWILLNKLNVLGDLHKLLWGNQTHLNFALLDVLLEIRYHLDHPFGVWFYVCWRNFRRVYFFHPLAGQIFYTEGVIHVNLEVHFMLEISWSEYAQNYEEKSKVVSTWLFINPMIESGKSY